MCFAKKAPSNLEDILPLELVTKTLRHVLCEKLKTVVTTSQMFQNLRIMLRMSRVTVQRG